MKKIFKKELASARVYRMSIFVAIAVSFLAICSLAGVSYGYGGMMGQYQGYGIQGRMGNMHNRMHPQMFMKFHKMGMLVKELHLTKTQVRKIWKLHRRYMSEMMKVRKMNSSLFLKATKDGSFNRTVFEKLSMKKAEEMIRIKARKMEDFFNILTPTQRKELIILKKIKLGDWSWYNGR